MRAWMRRQSLRTWLTMGMGLALAPVVISVLVGYLTYHTTVVAPFRQVLMTQHRIMLPLERLQGELWVLAGNVDSYSQIGTVEYRQAIQAVEARAAAQLAALEAAAQGVDGLAPVLDRAATGWQSVEAAAARVRPGSPAGADVALVNFSDTIDAVALDLETLLDDIRSESEASHLAMLRAMRRIEIGAGAALLLTLILGFAGVQMIDRALVASTDALVAGAMRVADGDRDRMVEVQIRRSWPRWPMPSTP